MDAVTTTPGTPSSFDDFPIGPALRESIRDAGFEVPTEVQRAAFEPIRAGRDTVIQARTGTGKTAAVVFPLIDSFGPPSPEPALLVLTPTRELALQFAAEVDRLGAKSGIRVAAVYGGVSIEPQIAAVRAGLHGIVGTPGRVMDLFDRLPRVTSGLRLIVLDEVDEMLSMGFERDVEAIIQRFPGRYQGIFLSATLPPPILRLAERFLRDPALVCLSEGAISPAEIRHVFFMIDPAQRLRDLLRIIEAERPRTSFIFCNTREDAQAAAAFLARNGLSAQLLSGELSQPERERVMAAVRAGDVAHLVATDVAARGIDVLHLTHVIHYQFPNSLDLYIHRAGRVGRLGQEGVSISLIGPQDVGNLYYLRLTYGIRPLERSLPTEQEIRREREAEFARVLLERYGDRRPRPEFVSLLGRLRTRVEGDSVVAAILEEHLASIDPRAAAEASETEKRRADAAAAAAAFAASAARESGRERGRPAVPDAQEPRFAGGDERRREGRVGRQKRRDSVPPAAPEGRGGDREGGREPVGEGMREVYLNVGARDGVEPEFISQWLQSRLGMRAGEFGPVRVRDRSTFVDVPAERAADAICALTGLRFGGRDVIAEEARRRS